MRTPIKTGAAAAALSAALALPTNAEPYGPCGDIDDEALFTQAINYYTVQDFAGYVSIQGMAPMPAGASGDIQRAVFWMDDGVLVASNDGAGANFHIEFERGEGGDVLGQYFDGASPGPMESDELAILMNCDIEDLPRLVGSAQVTVPEGGTMDLTLDLVFLGDIGMHGVMQWETVQHGRRAVIRKPVTLTPDD